jgi:hypothetical protein
VKVIELQQQHIRMEPEKMSRLPRIVSHLACVLATLSMAGCATFHFPFEKKMPKATASDPAVQILCLWQQGEGHDPEGYPCKGFAGQVLFLSNRAASPVQIDGDIRVYLFDDQGTEEDQTKPLRQFDFDSGSWNVHLSETSLGPTYNVFIPYCRRGVKDANCALRIRLKPKRGPTIFSDLCNMPLNGNKKPVMGEGAKPISDEENDRMAAEALSSKLRRTTTISMGKNPKTTESTAAVKADTAPGPGATAPGAIALASHQTVTEVRKESPKGNLKDKSAENDPGDGDRVRKLEAMVQQLLDEKANAAAAPTAPAAQKFTAPMDVTPSTPPRRTVHPLDDEVNRERIRPALPEQDRIRVSSRVSARPAASEPRSVEPAESVRRKHPLDE